MKEEHLEITIKLSSQTLDKLQTMVEYFNGRNELLNVSERVGVEELICGSVMRFIEEGQLIVKPLTMNAQGVSGVIKNNFKKICSENGIRQQEIVNITGIDKATISGIFNNKSQPSLDNFLKIWHVLNYPPINQCLYRDVE